ncbi:MAG: hypothetical protein WDO13_11045 [Verrucomicrobiota bacterium]
MRGSTGASSADHLDALVADLVFAAIDIARHGEEGLAIIGGGQARLMARVLHAIDIHCAIL